ncbi:6-pyruvoyltetrahydropterin/6-carboxytetrahydropterin synthase [Bryocella elongata]|uniref:6-carboxy-5,6,7,8-tetrahydropterin synthase n=1 Tax=Bryocella elongata TaxID=863522 RepID=A0A1H5TY94_9BACT|nr:6-carboxytetrahydropterin synthase [Bryocella elongata]SEF67739.1 6-pyruvoyltetrahydropterin/6-carboxytetrahydropterin synthase [Bryocella elongata]
MSAGTPIAHFGRRYHFSASHRLHCGELSAERNREVFGKCNNPFGHGHNYVVEVLLAGPIDAATGMVTNLADLDAFAGQELLARFDHQNLNLLPEFASQVSTTENLAVEIWKLFQGYRHATLKKVRVEETGNNSFEYFGER